MVKVLRPVLIRDQHFCPPVGLGVDGFVSGLASVSKPNVSTRTRCHTGLGLYLESLGPIYKMSYNLS